MNYYKIYADLIESATLRPELDLGIYTEKHHIIAKCLGGTDDWWNIVKLTPEEHFVAHQLLVKMYPGHKGLVYALNMMTKNSSGKRNNKSYAWIKRKHSNTCKGREPWNKGKKMEPEYGKRRGASNKGRVLSIEAKLKMSEAKKKTGHKPPSRKGIPMSEEQKQKLRNTWLKKKNQP